MEGEQKQRRGGEEEGYKEKNRGGEGTTSAIHFPFLPPPLSPPPTSPNLAMLALMIH